MADVKKKVNKNIKGGKRPVAAIKVRSKEIGPFYEYKMSKDSAYAITHDFNGNIEKDAKGRENDYLIDYVNSQLGLRGTCVAVHVG